MPQAAFGTQEVISPPSLQSYHQAPLGVPGRSSCQNTYTSSLPLSPQDLLWASGDYRNLSNMTGDTRFRTVEMQQQLEMLRHLPDTSGPVTPSHLQDLMLDHYLTRVAEYKQRPKILASAKAMRPRKSRGNSKSGSSKRKRPKSGNARQRSESDGRQ